MAPLPSRHWEEGQVERAPDRANETVGNVSPWSFGNTLDHQLLLFFLWWGVERM